MPLVPGRISGVLGRIGGCPTLVTLNVDQPPFQSVVTHLQRLRCVASSTCLIPQAKPYKAVRVLIGQPLSCNYILVGPLSPTTTYLKCRHHGFEATYPDTICLGLPVRTAESEKARGGGARGVNGSTMAVGSPIPVWDPVISAVSIGHGPPVVEFDPNAPTGADRSAGHGVMGSSTLTGPGRSPWSGSTWIA